MANVLDQKKMPKAENFTFDLLKDTSSEESSDEDFKFAFRSISKEE
jgi:hypothetical protein